MAQQHAIYAGSFDPLTNGHLDIIRRAAGLFDRLTVGVGQNPHKRYLFPLQERLDWVQASVGELAEVKPFDGLLVDFAQANDAGVIVRGLRTGVDFSYEFQMGMTNAQLRPEVETVFLLTALPNLLVSSSMVKEIARFGGDPTPWVPPGVAARLAETLSGQ